jgi:hypothetical protein
MAKIFPAIVIIILIILVMSAGCIRTPSSSKGGTNQQSPLQYGAITTLPTLTAPPTVVPTPQLRIGQIAATSSTATTGIVIVDYNNATGMYGTKEVKKNGRGDGWYTDGYKLTIWKSVANVERDNKYAINLVINPSNIPEYDSTQEINVFLSAPCDLAGNWNVNNGKSTYKFRLDNIVVNQTGNQTLIGDWVAVKSKDKRDFVIRWRSAPSPNSANYMEQITLSSDYSRFDSLDNYENRKTATWIGIIPSWKAELDKATPDRQAAYSSGTDCYKWIGGGEWYNKT